MIHLYYLKQFFKTCCVYVLQSGKKFLFLFSLEILVNEYGCGGCPLLMICIIVMPVLYFQTPMQPLSIFFLTESDSSAMSAVPMGSA